MQRKMTSMRRLGACVLAALLLGQAARAQRKSALAAPGIAHAAATPAMQVDPEAMALLQRMSRMYKAAETWQFTLEVRMHAERKGQPPHDAITKADVAVRKPDHLALNFHGNNPGAIYLQGTTMTLVQDRAKQYIQVPQPDLFGDFEAIDGALLREIIAVTGGTITCVLPEISADPYSAITRKTGTIRMTGQDKVDGVECIRLRLEQGPIPVDMWIAGGKQPLLVRIHPDMTSVLKKRQQPGLMSEPDKYDIYYYFKDQKLGGEIGPKVFHAQVPMAYRRVTTLGAAAAARSQLGMARK